MARRTLDLPPDRIAAVIAAQRGNISQAAKELGIRRLTLYRRIKASKHLQEVLFEARETMLDHVESRLYASALAGENWAVLFFLRTQGKSRGYVERIESTGAEGGPVKVTVTWDDGPDPDD